MGLNSSITEVDKKYKYKKNIVDNYHTRERWYGNRIHIFNTPVRVRTIYKVLLKRKTIYILEDSIDIMGNMKKKFLDMFEKYKDGEEKHPELYDEELVFTQMNELHAKYDDLELIKLAERAILDPAFKKYRTTQHVMSYYSVRKYDIPVLAEVFYKVSMQHSDEVISMMACSCLYSLKRYDILERVWHDTTNARVKEEAGIYLLKHAINEKLGDNMKGMKLWHALWDYTGTDNVVPTITKTLDEFGLKTTVNCIEMAYDERYVGKDWSKKSIETIINMNNLQLNKEFEA